MEFLNGAAAAAVWQRVQGEKRNQSLPEALLSLISAALTERRGYLRLTRFGAGAQVFRQLAQEEGCHARQLGALYFLLTGQTAAAQPGALAYDSRLSDALRERFAQELRSAAAYRAAAERWPEHRALFRALAAQEQAHADTLRRLTQRVL